MGVLRGKRCYLSGAIEYDNTGYNWRETPKKILTEGFGLDVWDPHADPKQQWSSLLRESQEKKDYETMAKISRQFLKKDLSLVDRSDLLIANLIYKIPTTGTVHEIVNAVNAKKPVILLCEAGKEKIPLWFYGFVPHQVMFGSWNDLYTYLREVEDMKHTENSRWAYIYGLI